MLQVYDLDDDDEDEIDLFGDEDEGHAGPRPAATQAPAAKRSKPVAPTVRSGASAGGGRAKGTPASAGDDDDFDDSPLVQRVRSPPGSQPAKKATGSSKRGPLIKAVQAALEKLREVRICPPCPYAPRSAGELPMAASERVASLEPQEFAELNGSTMQGDLVCTMDACKVRWRQPPSATDTPLLRKVMLPRSPRDSVAVAADHGEASPENH